MASKSIENVERSDHEAEISLKEMIMEKIKLIFSKFLNSFEYGLRGSSEEVLNLYKDSFEFIHEISKLITLLSSIASAFYIADIDKIKLFKIDSPFLFWFLAISYVCFTWRFLYRIYCLIVGSFVVNIHISEKLEEIANEIKKIK